MAPERRASRAGDVVAGLFDADTTRGMGAAQRAAKAWYVVNGDRERAHTTGVWLNKARRPNLAPVLVVGLDSSLLALELGTNKDLYLARLDWAGVEVSDVRFTVTGRAEDRGAGRRVRRKRDEVVLPDLTETERRQVEDATKDFPDGLRQSLSRAMSASLRRNKVE